MLICLLQIYQYFNNGPLCLFIYCNYGFYKKAFPKIEKNIHIKFYIMYQKIILVIKVFYIDHANYFKSDKIICSITQHTCIHSPKRSLPHMDIAG